MNNLHTPLLPDLTEELVRQSDHDGITARLELGLPMLDPIQPNEGSFQFPLELTNSAIVYRETAQPISLSDLEKDLEGLIQLGNKEATDPRAAPFFDGYISGSYENTTPLSGNSQTLNIRATTQGRTVRWEHKELHQAPLPGNTNELLF